MPHHIRSEYDLEVDCLRETCRSTDADADPRQTKSSPAGFPKLTSEVVQVERKGRSEIINQSVCPSDLRTCGCDAVRELHAGHVGSLPYDYNVYHSPPPSPSMSVTLHPSTSLGFNRASFFLSLGPSPSLPFSRSPSSKVL